MIPETPEKALEAINRGREAALAASIVRPLYEEYFDTIIQNAIMAFRGGKLDQVGALVAIGKIDALAGFMEDLEDLVAQGQKAAEGVRK